MSGKIMGQVWDLELPHAHMLVLLAYADHADHQGNNVYPGVGLIAWKAGYSLRQAQRITDELIAWGLLIEVEAKPGKPPVLRIDLSAGTQKPSYRGRQKVTRVKKSPVTFSSMGGDILADHGVTFEKQKKGPNGAARRSKPAHDDFPNRHGNRHVEPPPPEHVEKTPPIGGGGESLRSEERTDLYHWLRANGIGSPAARARNQHHDLAATQAFYRRIVGDAQGEERDRRIGRFVKELDDGGPPPLPSPDGAPRRDKGLSVIAADANSQEETRRKVRELLQEQEAR